MRYVLLIDRNATAWGTEIRAPMHGGGEVD
jgi:hypothetical protein